MGAPGKARSGLIGLGAPLLAICALMLGGAALAQAASPLKIREVFPGSSAAGANAEYVELQMTSEGQNVLSGQVLQFYDAGGAPSTSFAIPADVANGDSQRTVLLASQEAVTEGVVPTPDFILGSGSSRMDPSGGGVCILSSGFGDCLTWGSMPIQDLFSGFPDPQAANAAAISDGSALRRSISAGCATWLEPGDDTNNGGNDFAQVTPAPRNNASARIETRCAPDTTVDSSISSPTSQTSAAFTYSAVPSEPSVSFECRLDSAAFASCPSGGKSYPGPLAEGAHTFAVRAVGEAGPDPTPKTFSWTIDAKAPETTIDSFPPEPSGGFEATFTFHSSESPSSFRCQLDDGSIQVCSGSGKTYFGLGDGVHVFRVWAVDNAGNQDPTAAERSFTVQGKLIDVTPPDTSITAAPPNPSASESAAFNYASNEDGSSFECSLNSSPFAACPATGISYSRLRNGSYLFAVRATDRAGNVDSVPASYAWTVAAPLPRVKFTKAPPGSVKLKQGAKAKLLFKFKADKPGSTFRCRLDKSAFKLCGATTRVEAAVGRHRFEVYAIDQLGNVGTAKARRIFRVQGAKSGGLF